MTHELDAQEAREAAAGVIAANFQRYAKHFITSTLYHPSSHAMLRAYGV